MKKAIIASIALLFVQIAVFAQTPVVSTPENTPQTKTDKRGNRNEGRKEEKKGRKDEGGWKKSSSAERAVQYSQQLKSGLSLSDDQYQKVLAVNTECINRKDAARGSQDRSAMKTSKDDIKVYRQGEFQKIFTPEQFNAYQNLNKKGDDGDDDHGRGDKKDEKGGNRGKGKGRGDGKSREDDSKDNK